jgi:Leucine rich repeat
MRTCAVFALNARVGRALFRLGLAVLISIGAAPLVAAQSKESPTYTRFVFLLPDGFSGWICVDFGIAGAAPLPREGDALVIRPRPGEVLQTSDKVEPSTLFGEAWFEVSGKRKPLPKDVTLQPGVSRSGPREPTERGCVFVGTQDQRDAAEDSAPGFENLSRRHTLIPLEERQALEALYKATDGDHWKHRVGWLGPAGTECNWHGVGCGGSDKSGAIMDVNLFDDNLNGSIPEELGHLRKLQSLDLGKNNLVGAVPTTLGQLADLRSLTLQGNHFSGLLPNPLIQRWLAGPLDLRAENPLLTDVSEIDFESNPSALLCGSQRIILHSDGKATLFTKRCRNASPEDRSTFCEVKEGNIYESFAMLAWLLEKNGFFALQPEYSISVTDAEFFSTRVTRSGKTYEVVEYAGGGPFELWVVEEAIQGLAFSTDWTETKTMTKCPRWDDSKASLTP